MLVKYQNDKIENQHDNPRRLRGMALIVAILIVLVLSGLSLVALQAASNRLHLAGTARIATVAKSVAASGVEGTLALAASAPSGFSQLVSATNGQVPMSAVHSNFFDLATDGSGSFGREVQSMQSAGWNSRMLSMLTTPRAPGNLSGMNCFNKYVALTNGMYANVPDPGVTPDPQTNIDRNAQVAMLSNLFVGPNICP